MLTEDAHKTYKFCKNRARDPPLRGNYIGKIPIFSVLGAVNPTPGPILRGEKPENRPVSKNNTGRAALRADSAGKNKK